MTTQRMSVGFDYPNAAISGPHLGKYPVKATRTGTARGVAPNGIFYTYPAGSLRYTRGGIYCEPSRTNYLPYSQQASGAFTHSVIGVFDNYAQSLTLTAGDYTASAIFTRALTSLANSEFDRIYGLSYISITAGSATITQGNQYRVPMDMGDPGFIYSFGSPNTIGLFKARPFTVLTGGTVTINIGYVSSDVHGFDFVNIQEGSQWTTPIETGGTTMTRNSDGYYMDINQSAGNNLFEPICGTFLVRARTNLYMSTAQTLIHLLEVGAGTDKLTMQVERNPTTKLIAEINTYAGYTFFGSCDTPGVEIKAAMSYTDGTQLCALNGRKPVNGGPQTSAVDFTHINKMWIGCKTVGTEEFIGVIHSIFFYAQNMGQQDLCSLTF